MSQIAKKSRSPKRKDNLNKKTTDEADYNDQDGATSLLKSTDITSREITVKSSTTSDLSISIRLRTNGICYGKIIPTQTRTVCGVV